MNIGLQVNQMLQEQRKNTSSPEKKKEYEIKMYQKVKKGCKLSGSELEYVKKNMPELYRLIQRAENKKAAIEEKCKNAKSQEEIQDIYYFEMTHISEDDPAAELLKKAVEEAINKFKDSPEHTKLPQSVDMQNLSKNMQEEQQYHMKLGEYQEVIVGNSQQAFAVKG